METIVLPDRSRPDPPRRPRPRPADGPGPRRRVLRDLAQRPHVYVKVSSVLRRVDGRVPEDLAFYRDRLDNLFALFGEDRLVYGSDWPNSDNWAAHPAVLKVVREYFTAKGRTVAEKYFWGTRSRPIAG